MSSRNASKSFPSGCWALFLLIATSAVPAGTRLTGTDSSLAVLGLSALAISFELWSSGSKAGKGKQLFRATRLLPLRLGLLYAAQLLLIMPQISSRHAAHLSNRVAVPPPRWVPPAIKQRNASASGTAANLPGRAAQPMKRQMQDRVQSGEELAAAVGFQLDATPESLRWSPQTISVVLPCAEEREYALKTVESLFLGTPADVLHEIVVVDDGSNPPLSQTHLTPDVQQRYKVNIKRHTETVGLIGAKKTGGDAATGDIIVFFDCHVAPQPDWEKDFLRLIGENYRRMVVPQITGLNIDTWTQEGAGGGMSKCYVTWDGDFKWGGPNDMYMGMLSGGLAGMSRRWWWESGGFDDQMLGWGGENIDQGVRMWVCGGEIVAAPSSQVAHMWRTGNAKTAARYRRVGDTIRNRARAIYAWFGEFAVKLDDFPSFAHRKGMGDHWYGDMSTFQKVRDRLQGCRSFAWYLRRFKAVYEDGGIIPDEIFMIREEQSGQCLRFMGRAGTSGLGREDISLRPCDDKDHRFFWHLGNNKPGRQRCCSGFRAWNTEQCFQGASTSICDVSGRNTAQWWSLTSRGRLRTKRGDQCMGLGGSQLVQTSCSDFDHISGLQFTKQASRVPIETQLYRNAFRDHPEAYKLLNEQLAAMESVASSGPQACKEKTCVVLLYSDGRCLQENGELAPEQDECVAMIRDGRHLKHAETGDCLDSWSDSSPETWGFYGCHDGTNQQFVEEEAEFCTAGQPKACFHTRVWS